MVLPNWVIAVVFPLVFDVLAPPVGTAAEIAGGELGQQ